MVHILYVLAFTVIAFLAISNLIRNLINVGSDSRRFYGQKGRYGVNGINSTTRGVPHPELLDDQGKPFNEPLLVMRSVSVEEVRQQLDHIYNSSPSAQNEKEE